ncbi:hypothetical protein U1Q18_023422 [Sarracenia purpurea var. burkii]
MASRRCWERRGGDKAWRGRTAMATTSARRRGATNPSNGDAKREVTSWRDGDTRSGGVIVRFMTNNGDEREFQSGATARQP